MGTYCTAKVPGHSFPDSRRLRDGDLDELVATFVIFDFFWRARVLVRHEARASVHAVGLPDHAVVQIRRVSWKFEVKRMNFRLQHMWAFTRLALPFIVLFRMINLTRTCHTWLNYSDVYNHVT